MKTSKIKLSSGRSFRSLAAVILILIAFCQMALSQLIIPINNDDFDGGGGQIDSQLTILSAASPVGPQQIGTSGWYGQVGTTNVPPVLGVTAAGFRPGIEVDFDASSTNVGELRFNLDLSAAGGLLGLEMPEATLWQPLTGQSLLANSMYAFSVDVDAAVLLNVSAFSARGFGLGVTTGSTAGATGTYFADSLSDPSLLNISLLSGSTQQLTLTFTTGATPPSGNIGVAIFGGRGIQTLQAGLLSDFDVDNATLTVVPEPSSMLLLGIGLFVVLNGRVFLRRWAGRTA